MTLLPGTGGVFEVEADGELVYSKARTGLFPNERAVLLMLERRPR